MSEAVPNLDVFITTYCTQIKWHFIFWPSLFNKCPWKIESATLCMQFVVWFWYWTLTAKSIWANKNRPQLKISKPENKVPKLENKVPKLENKVPKLENKVPKTENKVLHDIPEMCYIRYCKVQNRNKKQLIGMHLFSDLLYETQRIKEFFGKWKNKLMLI